MAEPTPPTPPPIDPLSSRRRGPGWPVLVSFNLGALAWVGAGLVFWLMVNEHLRQPPPGERTMGAGFGGGLCLLFVVIPLAALGAILGIAGTFIRGRRLAAVLALLLNAAAVVALWVAVAKLGTR